jgi:DUF4097 and DUF4098 domain-containing protein YvlB
MTEATLFARAVTLSLLLALGAAPALAQEELDTTLTVRRGARLSVSNLSGSVVVRGWNRNEIRVQAEPERGSRVEIDQGPSRVSVRTIHRRGSSDVDYTISVPSGTAVDVNAISADIDVDGVCGEVNLNSVSGDVSVSCTAGDAMIQSVSGDVMVSDARGGLDVGSTSGDVDVRGARGPVSAHSVSGDVTLTQVDGDDVGAETVSGEILYSGRILDNGRYRFESHSGDVTVRVAGTLNAIIEVSTFSGDLDTDVPMELLPGARPSREWQFRQGNGSARLRLRSFSGTIYLRHGSAPNRED